MTVRRLYLPPASALGWVAATAGTYLNATATTTGTGWKEVIASMSGDAYVFGLMIGNIANTNVTLDLGIGGAGSEVSVASAYVSGPTSAMFHVPVRVASGTRVSVKTGTPATGRVGVIYALESVVGTLRPHVIAAAGAGASVATATTGTAWAQAIASTAAPIWVVSLGWLIGASASSGVCDLGIGGAGAEVVVASLQDDASGTYWANTTMPLVRALRIPASTRVAVRGSFSEYVTFSYFLESAVVQ